MKEKWCVAFPGREAVLKGMNRSFYDQFTSVRHLFEEASDIIKINMEQLSYSDAKMEHRWQTLCLVTHCYGIYKVMEANYGKPDAFSGYSQGEFTAFVAAGVIGFKELLKLIEELEYLLYMEPDGDECMYRIVNVELTKLEECCKQVDETGVNVSISSYISDLQNIISGKRRYVRQVIDKIKEQKSNWAIDLKVQKAYHSLLCSEAARKATPFFSRTSFYDSPIPVYCCYDGRSHQEGTTLMDRLSKQINHPIQWSQMMKDMADSGIFNLVEVGPGCTVSGNSRIADQRINSRWVGSVKDLW